MTTAPLARPNRRMRPATSDDRTFLRAMLAEAAAWRDGVHRPIADIISPPEIAHYLPPDWPRAGDAGVVAASGGEDVGAAWWTHFTADDPGYGFVAVDVSEVSIGVIPDERSRGVGTALLHALCAAADERNLRGLSLSVEADNPARRLYEATGFTTTDESAGAVTMLRWLPVR